MLVTVAIPVRNGGPLLAEVLAAVCAQRLPQGWELELLVCDSASTDGSPDAARGAGARVICIDAGEFSHGGTRNLLLAQARGELVALLTQDAVPAGERWLDALTAPLAVDPTVALAFGPYVPRPGASVPAARELNGWFRSLSPDGAVRVDRLAPDERGVAAGALYGPRAYFTDANGCIRRRAWEQVPFRPVAYAEDHALAIDMLRAGFAKAYAPAAAVIHSHEYRFSEQLRRSFDEARAVQELYGLADLGDTRRLLAQLRGGVGADLRAGAGLPEAVGHRAAQSLGTWLGARSQRLPAAVRGRLSLEGRR